MDGNQRATKRNGPEQVPPSPEELLHSDKVICLMFSAYLNCSFVFSKSAKSDPKIVCKGFPKFVCYKVMRGRVPAFGTWKKLQGFDASPLLDMKGRWLRGVPNSSLRTTGPKRPSFPKVHI